MTDTNQKPHYNAWLVTRNKMEGKKDFWLPLTRAFPHKSGDGYNIPLDRLGIEATLVLLPPRAEDHADAQTPHDD
jgi:hypothetical protein